MGGSIFRLDPDTLAVRDSFTWDMAVEALTVLDDSSIVLVGSGRMTMVSPEDQLWQTDLPSGINEGTIAVATDCYSLGHAGTWDRKFGGTLQRALRRTWQEILDRPCTELFSHGLSGRSCRRRYLAGQGICRGSSREARIRSIR